ncbi:hypothetical protein GCM10010837_18000 [Aminobacter niigataensis]
MNQIVPSDQTSTKEIGIVTGAGGSSIAPQNLGEVVRFAEVMARADIALPKHLRGNAGACMAVALQALEWQMSPFAVASKSYSVNGMIAYEAQLIAAVVNTRSGIKGRLQYEFTGTGNELACKVTGTLNGSECSYETPPYAAIQPKNSPLWKTDPRQQLGYYAARSWARRHCPEVILGVYDREEAEHFGPDNAKDVTPSVMQRLQAQQQPQDAAQPGEGFDVDFVTRETAALSGEASTDQEPSDTVPSSDDGSGEPAQASPIPAADPSAEDGGPEAGGIGAQAEPDVLPASDLTQEDRDWLKQTAKMLWAATGPGEGEVLKNQFAGIRDSLTPPTVTKAARDKGMSILRNCSAVCDGTQDMADTLELIAGIAGVEAREIV